MSENAFYAHEQKILKRIFKDKIPNTRVLFDSLSAEYQNIDDSKRIEILKKIIEDDSTNLTMLLKSHLLTYSEKGRNDITDEAPHTLANLLVKYVEMN
jgi:hypothetical protein